MPAPGESPFHIKGTALMGYLRFCDEVVPGGRGAVLERLETPELKVFFSQRFVVGGWYDVLPVVSLARAMASLLAIPHLDLLRRHARAQADHDINSVYRFMLRLASPEQVIRALPGTARRYFDFVRSEVREVARGHWEVTVRGVPAPVLVLYKSCTEAFILRALELAGAVEPRHHWRAQDSGGVVDGISILDLRREFSWDV